MKTENNDNFQNQEKLNLLNRKANLINDCNKTLKREKYEKQRASEFINNVKESAKKIAIVYVRASPIMEFLTGIMIAFLIYFSMGRDALGKFQIRLDRTFKPIKTQFD